MTQQKTEFRNDSGGIIGVVMIEPGGKEVALPVQPGESVWLSDEERIATANAPRRDEDNPFANGQLVRVGEVAEGAKNRRTIGDEEETPEHAEQRRKAQEAKATVDAANEAQKAEEEARRKAGQEQAEAGAKTPAPAPTQKRQAPEETAAPPQTQGAPAEGSRASGEEVGTPEAVGKA